MSLVNAHLGVRAIAAIAVTAMACGRLDFDPATPADARSAAPDAATCTLGPWGAPQILAAPSSPTATENGGQITGDGLRLYFNSDRDGTQDLFVATRDAREAAFGAPSKITELSGTDDDTDLTVSADELVAIFHRQTMTTACLFEATRASTAQPWGAPVRLDAICAVESHAGPYLTADGLTLYYNRAEDGLGEGSLRLTHRASRADSFAAGSGVAGVATTPPRGYPALSADQGTIYFEVEVGTSPTFAVHQASRATASAAFGPESAAPLGSADSSDPSITADGAELAFSSSAAGTEDLYEVTRECE